MRVNFDEYNQKTRKIVSELSEERPVSTGREMKTRAREREKRVSASAHTEKMVVEFLRSGFDRPASPGPIVAMYVGGSHKDHGESRNETESAEV